MEGRVWHRLMHGIGWFDGFCDAFWKGDKLYMSFVCGDCGKRTGICRIDPDTAMPIKEEA